MKRSISHSFKAETPEAKARWYQSLSLKQRMEVFNEYTKMLLAVNPKLAERKSAGKSKANIQVLRKAQG
jgi:hypothetical protein